VVAVRLGTALQLMLKRVCGRKRPCALAPHCWTTLLPPDKFSFPSGHTITAFAVASSLGVFYPGVLPGLLFCAASVALSRIMLGMHFLSDVLAGAVLGTALGYTAAALFSLIH
jgi:undecaprenyl-diphosphatase